jgi:hypothetical protein
MAPDWLKKPVLVKRNHRTGYSNQNSIELISNEYENQPHDITFLLNDIYGHFK